MLYYISPTPRTIHAQINQYKDQKVWNMFRVNNKDIRMTLMICSSVFIVNYEHILLLFFDDSFVDLEQINVLWGRHVLHVLTLPVVCISESFIEK